MTTPTLIEIPLDQVKPHPRNPRTDVGDLSELAASIAAQGVLEPIVVTKNGGGYYAIAGRRRIEAARIAKRTTIPAVLRDMTEAEAAAAALIENIQRKDLNPLEEARSYQELLELTGWTQKELGEKVGRAPSTIANALRLLKAPEPIRAALEKGEINAHHARIALSVPEKALPLLGLGKGVGIAQLEERARSAQRSMKAYEALVAVVEKARAAGKVVTWRAPWRESDEDRMVWLSGAEYSLEQLFGKSGPKFRGILGRHELAAHKAACDCDAVAIQGAGAEIEPCCISEKGYKKLRAREQSQLRSASPQKKKRIQSAKAKEARLRRVVAQSVKEATKAFEGRSLVGWRGESIARKVDENLLRGGLAGEPARVALFGFLAKFSDARGPMWKLELWKKIQTAPLAVVKERVAQYALAQGLSEIARASRYGDKYGNTKKIRELLNAHFAPARPKKAAKR